MYTSMYVHVVVIKIQQFVVIKNKHYKERRVTNYWIHIHALRESEVCWKGIVKCGSLLGRRRERSSGILICKWERLLFKFIDMNVHVVIIYIHVNNMSYLMRKRERERELLVL